MKNQSFFIIASCLGACAVLFGALGAHGLESQLSPAMLGRFNTAVEYQFYHALALLFTAIYMRHYPVQLLHYAAYAFITGTLLFSGSLYLYALSGSKVFVFFTPLGGLALFSGWGLLVYFFATQKADKY